MAGQGLAITAAAGSGNMPRFFMRFLYAIFIDVARNLIVGDIHGQYSMLMKALDRAGFDPDSDVLYTTGDIADKGPDSAAVVAFLHSLPDCRMVMGNHDVWLENYLLTGRAPPIWLNENGGSATVRSFGKVGLTDTARAIFGRWIASIPFCRVEERYIIVHAGISDRYDIDDIEAIAKLKRGRYETGSWFSDKKDFIWDRTYITAAIEYEEKGKTAKGARQPLETERTIFVGHTPLKAPFSSGRYHLRAVDTGAGHPGGYLTLMDMDTGEWWKSQRWV